ncbi:MAG: hypothetical protein V1735_03945 [Nanoarchaeota archaeon]
MRVSNNALFLIALLFFCITLVNLVSIWKASFEVSTGHAAVRTGEVFICISKNISILSTNFSGREYESFYDTLVMENPDTRQLNFSENTSLFEVDPSTGVISFTPLFNDVGEYDILFRVNDLDPYCGTMIRFKVIPFTIHYMDKNGSVAIWDDTDEKGGNQTKYVRENVTFYANYTSNTTNQSANGTGVYCTIVHNDTGQPSQPANMTFNATTLLYKALVSFTHPGYKEWNVTCIGVSLGYSGDFETDQVLITNRPPVLVSELPNQTWYMNTHLTGLDLDDYFVDPDGDVLNFSFTPVHNITINISASTHVVTFMPATGFNGERFALFYADDPFSARTESNLITLTVLYREPPPEQQTGASGGSGGGGGGGISTGCYPRWECTAWGPCLPSGMQRRTCTDVMECHGTFRPNLTQLCEYEPTCYDLIRNQNETGVDCGGPCGACPTCDDSVQNGGETGIDCGGLCYPCGNCTNGVKDCHNGSCELGVDCSGPCEACLSCSDGFRNQGETAIDCGGPCGACPTCSDKVKNGRESGVDCGGDCRPCLRIELPAGISRSVIPVILIILLAILVIGYASYRLHRKLHIVMAFLSARLLRFERKVGIKEKPIPAQAKLRAAQLLGLQKLEQGFAKASAQVSAKGLSDAMARFAQELLHVKGSMTHEELLKALKASHIPAMKKAVLISYLMRIEGISYTGSSMPKDRLKKLIAEAKSVVDTVTPQVSEKEEARAVAEVKAEPIEAMLAELRIAIKVKDAEKASSIYKRIKAEFAKLSPDRQKAVFGKVKKAYELLIKLMDKNDTK